MIYASYSKNDLRCIHYPKYDMDDRKINVLYKMIRSFSFTRSES